MKKYDYLIVGAGLFGAVFAYEAMKRGKTCLVIARRDHIAGNIYCETIEDIQVWCTYLPYLQSGSLELHQPVRRVQQLHQLSDCHL